MVFLKKYPKQTILSAKSNRMPNTSEIPSESKHSIDVSELLSVQQSLFTELAIGNVPRKNLIIESVNDTSRNSNNKNTQLDNQEYKQKNWFKRLISLPAYHWVLLSQSVVLLPHFAHMPYWLVGYGLFSVVMQLPKVKYQFSNQKYLEQQLSQQQEVENTSLKNHNANKKDIRIQNLQEQVLKKQVSKKIGLKSLYRVIQLITFLVGVGSLWLSFGGFNVESGIAFLLLCLASKMWELYERRDALVVLNLSLFVSASLFLLDQGLGSSLQAFTATMMVLMAFVTMNDDTGQLQSSKPELSNSSLPSQQHSISNGSGRLRTVALLAGLSFPLMVVLFLFFPRLPPLWALQLSSTQAKTGVSNSMSPGDFANLSQSTELAFRVEFDTKIPMFANMYWRGLVFSDFDGRTWQQNNQPEYWIAGQEKPSWFILAENTTTQPAISYQVMLEPTNQKWLFALDYPYQLGKTHSIDTNYSLQSDHPITQQQRYKQSYKPDMQIGMPLSVGERAINLALPKKGNNKTRELANRLYAEAIDDTDYINLVKKWFDKGNFHYTLSPPALGNERIDEFLFTTQAGFCEHYSSTFVFMMRSAGIPARVVVGYQGGELGRDGKSWEVRQMDAHAWTEVWLKETGWKRVDPTSWVAPERVEKGMDALSNTQGSSLFGDGILAEISYQQYKMLQDIRRISDQMSYYWDTDIVGYDKNKQSNSLLKWFNIKNWYQQVIIMIVVFISLVVFVSIWLWWRRRIQWHIADYGLIQLSKRLGKEKESLARKENEGMLAWIERLENDAHNCRLDSPTLMQIKVSYRKLRYGHLNNKEIKDAEYQRELKQLHANIKSVKV